MSIKAHRGEILHCLEDPGSGDDEAWEYLEDGILIVEDGHVSRCGPAADVIIDIRKSSTDIEILEHPNGLIIPGMIDTHIHFPQCEIIASYGTQLIEWLEAYTFPIEMGFSDSQKSHRIAKFFLGELLRNGTTTALVFGTVHSQSVDAFFEEARNRNQRMICGKVMMDRHAPDGLCDTPESSYNQSADLIKRWHGKDRLGYAVTPRFAPTSTSEQLTMAGKLLEQYPDVHLHTHLSENVRECQWVKELFPRCRDYLDVYDSHGLLGRRSVFAHGIHLCEREWKRMAHTGSNLSFCPTSNLFIGSGLFDLNSADKYGVRVGLGTDIGGGDSFSILRTINEAYKVQQLKGNNLAPMRSFYLATLGGARALDLDSSIGNFEIGKEADFVVLDYASTPLIEMRCVESQSIREKLFVLEMLGDDRAVRETWVMGKCQHRKLWE
jgi:guanine deaminase